MVAEWSVPVLRLLTKLTGVVLIILGIVGVIAGETLLFGAVNVDIVEDIVHLATGGFLLYAGLRSPEPQLRTFVGALGVASLLAGLSGFPVPNPLGLIPHHYQVADNLLHITLGVLAIFFTWIVRSPTTSQPA